MSVRQGRQRISLCRSPDVDTPVPLKGWALLLRTPRPLEKSYKKGRHRVGDEMGAAKLNGVSESTLQHTRRVLGFAALYPTASGRGACPRTKLLMRANQGAQDGHPQATQLGRDVQRETETPMDKGNALGTRPEL